MLEKASNAGVPIRKQDIMKFGKGVELFDGVEDHIDQCINQAILVTDKKLIAFRHELARLAILNSIPELKRIQLHQRVLNYLLEVGNEQAILARILHHASQARDNNAIIKYAPLAASRS